MWKQEALGLLIFSTVFAKITIKYIASQIKKMKNRRRNFYHSYTVLVWIAMVLQSGRKHYNSNYLPNFEVIPLFSTITAALKCCKTYIGDQTWNIVQSWFLHCSLLVDSSVKKNVEIRIYACILYKEHKNIKTFMHFIYYALT